MATPSVVLGLQFSTANRIRFMRRPRRRPRTLSILSDDGGAVAFIFALTATVLVAILGLGIDVSYWYRTDRDMQNAADAAAIAAARNGTSSYDSEAKAVAAQYGFVDGTNIHVRPLSNQICPNGQTDCFLVTIAMDSAPQFFSQVIGFPAPALSGASMAGGGQTHYYCLLALASTGTDPAITTNGAPKADLSGCNIMSNTGADCNGHNLKADNGDAHKTDSGCGVVQNSNVPPVADPYKSLASDIPTGACSSVTWSGNVTLPAVTIVCGDQQLTSDTNLTTDPGGSVLVIENGQLNTNCSGGHGHSSTCTLKEVSGGGLTIIFTGNDPLALYTHAPTGSGTLDFYAPTSGTWSGVAIYQDPALPGPGKAVDITAAGNSPTWNITGLVYLPHAHVEFSGVVNKSSNGQSCFALVVDNIRINGTGDILAKGGCAAAGLHLPTDTVGTVTLVK
jgi:hypothetical protein